MKNIRKHLAVLLVLFMLVQYLPSFLVVSAADAVQYNYSDTSNSGKRNEVATTLAGTGAGSYYTNNYQYDSLSKQSSATILSSLRSLLTTTHTKTSSYDTCQNMADQTDCENNNGKVTLLYTSVSTTSSNWNREHVWPKSLGGFNTSGPGADMHHIRPTDDKVNNYRSSLKFGEVTGTVKQAIGANAATGVLGGYYNSSYFEPLDNVKGDVARICLYMYVRYGASYTKCSSITNVFQSIDVLLQWCKDDPVDTWELGRNEVVEAYQGNRNVFIDYPEYAWLLFGREVPSDMATPSKGGTGSTTPSNPSTPTTPTTPSTPSNPTTDKEILDAAYALSAGAYLDGTYTLTGKITVLDSYNNPTIVVGNYTSQPIYCYRLVDERFVVGATITVTGKIMNYNGLIEMKDCTLVSITLPSGAGSGGSETTDPQPGVTVTGTGTIDFSSSAQRESQNAGQQVWKNDGITVLNEKGGSNIGIADYTNPVRFYASTKLTITATGMTKIVFTCSSAEYATNLKNSITSGNVRVDDTVVTVTFASPVNSFVIDSFAKQVRVKTLTVETSSTTQEPTVPPTTEPPVTEPPVTEPPVTEPPVTEPPVTEPPATVPPVESNKDGFLEVAELIIGGTYKGEAFHTAVSAAAQIYNDLSDADKASVAQQYSQLKEAIASFNEDAAKVNADADNAGEIFLGAFILISSLSLAGYALLGKKFF